MIKSDFNKIVSYIVGFFLILFFSSCQNDVDSVSKEEQGADFLNGQAYLREGRKDLALKSFLKVVKTHDYCPESHFELGIMFLNDFSDPVESIHHFRKYLQQKPDSKEQEELVSDLLRKAKLQFAKTLAGRPFRDEIDRVDLLNLLQKERENNAINQEKIQVLQKRLAKYEKLEMGVVEIPNIRGISIENDATYSLDARQSIPDNTQMESARIYEVQPGDTLSKISEQFYGNRNQWEAIYQANRDILSSPGSLDPGQKLQIP